MAEITISEGLTWLKMLRERHAELVGLRNENSHNTRRHYGVGGDKEVTTEPTYDVKALDRMVTRVQREQRKLETAIKNANAITKIPGYDVNLEDVLGELE